MGRALLQQYLFYTNKDPQNYLFINVGASIPIITWKLTKNFSHIISDRSLSSCSLYSRNNQRTTLDVESSSIPVKDVELFYRLIERLLITSKITRPDVLDCVTYVLTIMELLKNHCKNRNLNTDLLFLKKIQIIVLLSAEDQCTHFEMLLSKYKSYIIIILQQIIQS